MTENQEKKNTIRYLDAPKIQILTLVDKKFKITLICSRNSRKGGLKG